MYGAELEDDEDEVEEELRAREAAPASGDEAPQSTPAPKTSPEPVKEAPPATEQKESIPEQHRDSSKTTAGELHKPGDEGGELLPKAAHDATK